ncbi:MAG: hypothetical protein IJU95_02395 [Treponema sp.]|nr:hypothetical protein [Treponema sp.]
MKYTAILLVTAFLVYSLKALRLYFLLVGEGTALPKYICVFSRTTFVNILLPFKLGELYRIYSFGNLTRSFMKGAAVVLLDRFIDLCSILAIFIFMKLALGIEFEGIFFFLAVASVFLILSYLIQPGMLSFWNSYFMESRASARHLKGLAIVKSLGEMRGEVKGLLEGRFFLIFTLSLLSWLLEISPLLIFGGGQELASKLYFARYLSSTLTGNEFAPQRDFALMSLTFLAAVYLLTQIIMLSGWLAARRNSANAR